MKELQNFNEQLWKFEHEEGQLHKLILSKLLRRSSKILHVTLKKLLGKE
jgi:hypothetical protein